MKFPRQLNIGSGKNFREDCLNLDIDEYWEPDIVYDLNKPFPEKEGQKFVTSRFGEIEIRKNSLEKILAYDVLEHIPNLTACMKSCLDILKQGGILDIMVPYDLSYGAWQDPTHVRAFNEKSWLYYADWFWYLGWTQARFTTEKLQFKLSDLGIRLQSDGRTPEDIMRTPRAVDLMSVQLRKILLSETDRQQLEHLRGKPRGFKREKNLDGRYCIWVVSPPGFVHSQAFDEVAIALKSGFSKLGFHVPVVRDVKNITGQAIVLGCNLIPKVCPNLMKILI